MTPGEDREAVNSELRTAFLRGMKGEPGPGHGGDSPSPNAVAASAAPPGAIVGDSDARAAFLKGFSRRALPENALVIVSTTARSAWYRTQRCAECDHTFRIGDPVMVCPSCDRVYHQHPLHGLECFAVIHEEDGKCCCGWSIPGPVPPPVPVSTQANTVAFLEGLSRSWRVYRGLLTTTVTGETRLEGRLCAVCGDSVRLGEIVVRCPCGHGPAGSCGTIIHHDLGRQLHCWNDWNQGRGRAWCPTSGRPYVNPTSP